MGELDEKDTPPRDTKKSTSDNNHHDNEEPKETDKMLEMKKNDDTNVVSGGGTTDGDGKKIISPTKTSTPEKKLMDQQTKRMNGEEIINIPDQETTKDDNNLVVDGKKPTKLTSKEDREVKPKKIPIGGIKMPGFFTKIKPRSEGDGADGELLEKEVDDNKANEEKPKKEEKRPCIGDRIRNFFSRKPTPPTGPPTTPKKDDGKPNELVGATANDETQQPPPQKRGLLNAIKLPIANMIPKRKTEDDVEMGYGPGTKAGLASMETLDDSLKDQDTVDKAPISNNGDGIDKLKGSQEIKSAADDKNADNDDKPAEEQISCLDRIRGYTCSVDDALIALGIILFVLLLGVIGYVLSHENLTQAPLREGLYIDAVTSCGMVEGLAEDGAYAFRGIPYAEPPIGLNRFKPSKLIQDINDCWNGTLKAHNSSELCSQILSNGTKIGIEDCLTLDVITPHVRYDNPVPVVILIGAESLTGGSPGILRPSARFARYKDVVFVRPNFRLGALGFLALDSLSKSTHPPVSGNYGLWDIISVLKWVQLNIQHFGGDPKSVTLFGHRAGGTLVSALITSPLVKDLYTRAWVSSSGALFPGRPLVESERLNQAYMDEIECKDMDCLLDASVDNILDATLDTWRHSAANLPLANENSSNNHEWLVLDGQILQVHPADVWKIDSGIPKLVIGTTAHESHNDKLYLKYTNWTAEDIHEYIESSKLGVMNLTDEAIQLYNATTYQGLVSMISDIRTICPLLTIARQQPSAPFYVVIQPENRTGLADVDADVQAILGRYEPHTVEQRRYLSAMQQLFYHYVSHGEMKQYEPRRRVLNVGQDALTFDDYSHCNFWIKKDIVPRYARID